MLSHVRALVLGVAIIAITGCTASTEKATDPAIDDLAYLTQLGLMRGHLFVGKALYDEGFRAASKTHMKHPKSELYASLEPAFVERGHVGFASELEQLASAVEDDQSPTVVNEAYQQLVYAISVAEQAAPSYTLASMQFQRVAELLRTAYDEYNEGIVDGVTTMPHEYQDAYGFTEVAKQILKSISAEAGSAENVAVDHALQQINTLKTAWPGLVPPSHVSFDSEHMARIAAEIGGMAKAL